MTPEQHDELFSLLTALEIAHEGTVANSDTRPGKRPADRWEKHQHNFYSTVGTLRLALGKLTP